jgi:thioesterase domain-containing protein
MTTFALVHGAWHGAWCWDRLAPLLRAAGHPSITVDLPTEDAGAGTAQYARVVLDALERDADDGPVVLVGHSAAGLTLPLVAAARPVQRMVFVSALLPRPGEAFVVQDERERVLLDDYKAGVERTPSGLRRWFDPELAARYMYNHCSAEDAAWAYERLRPQASTMYTEPSPLAAWPDVPVVDVRGDDDLLVSPRWAAAAVPQRLGVASIVLPAAGHSSLISHAPELAQILLDSIDDSRDR